MNVLGLETEISTTAQNSDNGRGEGRCLQRSNLSLLSTFQTGREGGDWPQECLNLSNAWILPSSLPSRVIDALLEQANSIARALDEAFTHKDSLTWIPRLKGK